MTTTHTHKTIVAAIVAGALALAAPAGAYVLDGPSTDSNATVSQPSGPITDSSNSSGTEVQTVNATISHQSSQGDSTQVTALRRDGSQAEAFVANVGGTPVAHSGDGFDLGDAAIGAGAGLLAATALMLGTGAIGRRHKTTSKPGNAVSQGA